MTRRAFALVGSWLGVSLLPLTIIFDGHHTAPLAVRVSDGLGYVGLVMLAWQFILNARTRTLDELFGAKAVHALHRYGTWLALTLLAAHPVILFVLDPARYLRLLDLLTAPWRARAALTSAALLALLVLVSWKRIRGRFNAKLWRSLHRTAGVVVVALGLIHIVLVGHYTAGWQGASLVTVILGVTLLPMVWVREPAKKSSKQPPPLLPRLYFGLGLHRVSQTLIVLLICGAAMSLVLGHVVTSTDMRPAAFLPPQSTPSTIPTAGPSVPGASSGSGSAAQTKVQTGQAASATASGSPSQAPTATTKAPVASTPPPATPAPILPAFTPTPSPMATPDPMPTATPTPTPVP